MQAAVPLSIAFALPLFALAACGAADGVCGPMTGRVAQVRDGDTIVLVDGEVVRYLGIDTPERDACFGDDARLANAALVAGVDVVLEDDVRCRDVYDRRLAYVSVKDGDVGTWLLERGFAKVEIIPPNQAREVEYRAAAEAARAARRGLWGSCR